MKREINVTISPECDVKKETARLSLHFPGQNENVVLDVNGASLLKISRAVPDLAQDFLTIAACIYAADKAVDRQAEDDKWTRHLAIEIPVEHVEEWSTVAEDLSACVGFLTGDLWEITFRRGEKRLIQKKERKRQIRYRRPTGKAVCLFSGGLDSFIGAIDWLNDNPGENLLLVGHYDRDVAGPAADQRALREVLRQNFAGRFELAQTQVGLFSGGVDTNFRSRSLLFIALGCYFAEILGENTPMIIPENGPIAVNFPLTPARRGSCSTRTVHPFFINSLNQVLTKVGVSNPVYNPYKLKTKGEMVDGCRDPFLLASAYAFTRSCAKMNRRQHWANTKARSCGMCVPCLFRRASLYNSGNDCEVYGDRVEDVHSLVDTKADLLALLAFLRMDLSDRQIAAGLIGNGSLPLNEIALYVDLIKRMRLEVITWLRAKGSNYLKNEIRAC